MRTIRNEKGLTLVEVTAVLVLTLIIISSLIYLLNHTNAGVKNVTTKEQTLQQTRTITDHIVASVRKGFVMPNGSYSNLRLTGSGNQFVQYHFDDAANTFEVEYLISDESGVEPAAPTKQLLSNQVASISFEALDGEMEIILTMHMPNNNTYTTTTTVNSIVR